MSDEDTADFIAFPPKPWPKDVPRTKGLVRKFIEEYKRAFDVDPLATFCAGELDDIVLVIANGAKATELRSLVQCEWMGVIEKIQQPEPPIHSEPPRDGDDSMMTEEVSLSS